MPVAAEVAAAIFACLLWQAFFSASEIAIVSADDVKVRAETGKDSKLLGDLLARRDRLLALVLTSTNIATVTASAVLTNYLHARNPRLTFLAAVILVPLSLMLGESLPKLLTLRHPIGFVRFAATPL